MPQSTAAARHKAQALRVLRHPTASPQGPTAGAPLRPVWAKRPLACQHGNCLALEVRGVELFVLVEDAAGVQAWGPVGRILAPEQRRAWAREGFG